MKPDRQGENQQAKMPHVPPGQESGPVAQRLHRGVRDLLAKLTQAGKEERTTKTQRQPGRGVNRDRDSIGLDLGDKRSPYGFLDVDGEIVTEGSLAPTREEFTAYFSAIPQARMAVEVGTHSAWVSEVLTAYGHDVVIAHPRRMESMAKNRRQHDKVEARTLARLVRVDPELLYPIQHRGAEVRRDLVLWRARNARVEARTSLINQGHGRTRAGVLGGELPYTRRGDDAGNLTRGADAAGRAGDRADHTDPRLRHAGGDMGPTYVPERSIVTAGQGRGTVDRGGMYVDARRPGTIGQEPGSRALWGPGAEPRWIGRELHAVGHEVGGARRQEGAAESHRGSRPDAGRLVAQVMGDG
jgi:Transposase